MVNPICNRLESQKLIRVESHHLYYMCSKCPPPDERKRWTLMPLVNETFNNRVTQSGPLNVDALFHFLCKYRTLSLAVQRLVVN